MLDREALEAASAFERLLAYGTKKLAGPKDIPGTFFKFDSRQWFFLSDETRDIILAALAAQGEAAVAVAATDVPIIGSHWREAANAVIRDSKELNTVTRESAWRKAVMLLQMTLNETTPPAPSKIVVATTDKDQDGRSIERLIPRREWEDNTPPASAQPVGKWEIDNSTPSPILMYEKCSVIQDEQAHYVLGLIQADIATVSGVSEAMVEAAKALDLHLDKLICYASTCSEYEPNKAVRDFRNALEAALANGAAK